MLIVAAVSLTAALLRDSASEAPTAHTQPPARSWGYLFERHLITPTPAVLGEDMQLLQAIKSPTPRPTDTPAPTPSPQPTTPPTPAPQPPAPPPPAPDPTREPVAAEVRPVVIPTPAPTPTPPPGTINGSLASQLLQLVNAARTNAGVPPLTAHSALVSAATDYAAFHFLNADPFQLSHNLNGSLMDRIRYYGYMGGGAETLAVGAPDAQGLFEVWMNSPPHRDLLLNAQYVDIGVGCYEGPYKDASGNVFQIALCVADLGYT